MDKKSYHGLLTELTDDTALIGRFWMKQKIILYIFLGLGIVMIVFWHTTFGLIGGIIFSALALYNIFVVKDRIILDMYPEYMILYDERDETMGYKINYADIDTYATESTGSGSMYIFTLVSGEVFKLNSSNGKIFSTLHKIIPEKEKFRKLQDKFKTKRRKKKKDQGQ